MYIVHVHAVYMYLYLKKIFVERMKETRKNTISMHTTTIPTHTYIMYMYKQQTQRVGHNGCPVGGSLGNWEGGLEMVPLLPPHQRTLSMSLLIKQL